MWGTWGFGAARFVDTSKTYSFVYINDMAKIEVKTERFGAKIQPFNWYFVFIHQQRAIRVAASNGPLSGQFRPYQVKFK